MPIIDKSTFTTLAKKARFRSLAPSTLEKREGGKRLFRKAMAEKYWSDSAGLSEVNKATNGLVLKELKHLSSVVPNSVVVEWGCGKGKALATAAKMFPSLKFFGFSKTIYPEWEKRVSSNGSFLSTGPS